MNIDKLPKWAQEHIADLQRKLEETQRKLIRVEKQADKDNKELAEAQHLLEGLANQGVVAAQVYLNKLYGEG